MSLPPPRLYGPAKDKHLLDQLVRIHADCIRHDKQLATFLNLEYDPMLAYWTNIHSDVEKDRTAIFLQFADDAETTVAGYVCLMMPVTETGPFRAEVNKLMVSTKHRRIGVARRVMGLLEDYAKKRERYLLILDTTIGLPAENVYPKLGYTLWGVLPKYGISPEDGRLVDEKFFYKDLRESKTLNEV